MVKELDLKLKIHFSIDEIDKKSWDEISDLDNPFLDYDFLSLLESSNCIGPATTSHPVYFLAYRNQKIVGRISSLIKYDSNGEYIFDWSWANASYSAGIEYYPKLVITSPFTPVSGQKIIVDEKENQAEIIEFLIQAIQDFSIDRKLSSIHFLFIKEEEQEKLSKFGFLSRYYYQFHWENLAYENFDDFLKNIYRKKRHQIKKERKDLAKEDLAINILTQDQITQDHIEALWQFYVSTHQIYQNPAYLNKNFFDGLINHLTDRMLIVMAKKHHQYLGGTLNFIKNQTIFGRYWGAIQDIKNLHFECCFYQLIDYAILKGLKKVEAGAGGEQKFLRGYKTVPVYSSHYIFNERLNFGIKNFLAKESRYIKETINHYNEKSPLIYLRNKKVV